MSFIALENNRCRLRPIKTLSDADCLKDLAIKETYLAQFSPSFWHDDISFKTYFKTAIEARFPFSIYDKRLEAYAGSTSFGNYDITNERIEIGWTWLGKSFQKTGLNSNIKFLMLQFAFEHLNLKRVEFKADARNIQSRKAMEGIGAKYEGALRSHTVMGDGFRRDTVYYSILLDEWPKVSKKLSNRIKV